MNDNIGTTVDEQEISITVTEQQVRALFTGMGVLDHNTLSGLQGGNDTERYHLTNAELTTKWVKRAGDSMTGDLSMTNNHITGVGSLLFDIAAVVTHQEGLLHWDSEDGTLEIGMPGGVVAIQLGQEQVFPAKNKSGSDIANGAPIVITGASGNRPEIDLATTTPQTTSGAIGMATELIADGHQGFVTTFGLVRDINTFGIAAGARAFLSDTPGELSASLPAAANRKVFMGMILRSHAEEGIILLAPINLLFFGEMSGVVFTNLQVGDVPTWDGTKWINQAP